MNEVQEKIIDKLVPDSRSSLIRYFVYLLEYAPSESVERFERMFEETLENYKKGNSERFETEAFATLWAELWYTNDVRKEADSERVKRMCDKMEKFLLGKLHEELNPKYFSRNYRDFGFIVTFCLYCNHSHIPEPGKDFMLSWWAEENCDDKKAALLPHVETPFIAMLIRYTWYHRMLELYENNDTFRAECLTVGLPDFTGVTGVKFGNYSREAVCEQYALSYRSGLRDIPDEHVTEVKTREDIPSHWYLILLEKEANRFRKDEQFLNTILPREFVSSLISWHKSYIKYLIKCLRSDEKFKDYPLDSILPPIFTKKAKSTELTEDDWLTQKGKQNREELIGIIKKRAAKSQADIGKFLYELQFERKWVSDFTKNKNAIYRLMEKMANISISPSGDFSNCNKGYNEWKRAKEEKKK